MERQRQAETEKERQKEKYRETGDRVRNSDIQTERHSERNSDRKKQRETESWWLTVLSILGLDDSLQMVVGLCPHLHGFCEWRSSWNTTMPTPPLTASLSVTLLLHYCTYSTSTTLPVGEDGAQHQMSARAQHHVCPLPRPWYGTLWYSFGCADKDSCSTDHMTLVTYYERIRSTEYHLNHCSHTSQILGAKLLQLMHSFSTILHTEGGENCHTSPSHDPLLCHDFVSWKYDHSSCLCVHIGQSADSTLAHLSSLQASHWNMITHDVPMYTQGRVPTPP